MTHNYNQARGYYAAAYYSATEKGNSDERARKLAFIATEKKFNTERAKEAQSQYHDKED